MYYNNPYMLNQGQQYTQPYIQAGYTPQYNQAYNQGVQSNNNIIWVQGEVGARSYQLPPSSSVLLLDNDDSKFYIKTTDASGMATLKEYKFEEYREQKKQDFDTEQYVTKQEFQEFKANIEAVYNALKGNQNKGVITYESDIPIVQ